MIGAEDAARLAQIEYDLANIDNTGSNRVTKAVPWLIARVRELKATAYRAAMDTDFYQKAAQRAEDRMRDLHATIADLETEKVELTVKETDLVMLQAALRILGDTQRAVVGLKAIGEKDAGTEISVVRHD